MAEVTLSDSNSKVVVAIAGNQGYRNRIKALVFEHALNLRDTATTPTPTTAEGAWADAVLGGRAVNEVEVAAAIAVQADPSAVTIINTVTDAQLRTQFDLVIGRCISAWVAENP